MAIPRIGEPARPFRLPSAQGGDVGLDDKQSRHASRLEIPPRAASRADDDADGGGAHGQQLEVRAEHGMRPPAIVRRQERQRPAQEMRQVLLGEALLKIGREGGAEAPAHGLRFTARKARTCFSASSWALGSYWMVAPRPPRASWTMRRPMIPALSKA